jgi:hypothetical protein
MNRLMKRMLCWYFAIMALLLLLPSASASADGPSALAVRPDLAGVWAIRVRTLNQPHAHA